MKTTLCLLLLVSCVGCSALNSLIIHPISVLHQQHEYNEVGEDLAEEWAPSK